MQLIVLEELTFLGTKKDAPACCMVLFAEVMTLPSVYARCCQSGILGCRGCVQEGMLV